MRDFDYVRVSDRLVEQLDGALVARQHILVVGPPGIGKSYLVMRIRRDLEKRGSGPIGTVGFGESEPVGDLSPSSVFAWIDDQFKQGNDTVYLFALDVDAIEHVAIERFMRGLRDRIRADDAPGGLTVVLTGAAGLVEVLDNLNPPSCLDRARFIQGFERPEFEAVAQRILASPRNRRSRDPGSPTSRPPL